MGEIAFESEDLYRLSERTIREGALGFEVLGYGAGPEPWVVARFASRPEAQAFASGWRAAVREIFECAQQLREERARQEVSA